MVRKGKKLLSHTTKIPPHAQRDAILTLAATDVGSKTVDITLTQEGTTPLAVPGLPTLAKDIRFYPNPASQTLYIEGISEETVPYSSAHSLERLYSARHFEPK